LPRLKGYREGAVASSTLLPAVEDGGRRFDDEVADLAARSDEHPPLARDELPLGKMRDGELLFPSEAGGFRSQTLLGKPFEDVCKHLKLKKRVTPKGMRRTFQDLARQVGVAGLVQRSICGHLTEEMTERYSSVGQTEVEAALGKVISFAGYAQLSGSVHRGGKVVGNDIFNAREPRDAAH
jgi:hypothetical protein